LLAYPAANTVEDKALKIAPTERALIDGCDACPKHADSDLANFARRLMEDVEALNVELCKLYNHCFVFSLLTRELYKVERLL
jgi:hypothetical protein